MKTIKHAIAFLIFPFINHLIGWSERHSLFSAGVTWRMRRNWRNSRRHLTHNRKLLTCGQKQAIRDFWKRYCNIGFVEHQFYTEKNGRFSPYYMPDSIYYTVIDQYFNDWKLAKIVDNKCWYSKMFPNFKMPKHICCKVGRLWQSDNGKIISFQEVIDLICSGSEVIIKQATSSCGGAGIKFFDPRKMKASELIEILESINGDIVVQETLKQSATLARLNPSSVNSVRITTLLEKNGSVKVCSSFLRMGINGARMDNACSGGICCGILPDGRLKPTAYNQKGVPVPERHPDSKIRFEDVVIPGFEEAKRLACENQLRIPHFRLASWDIAFDQYDNPVLLEVNLSYGEVGCHQINNGPLFGDDTERILNEVFGKEGR